jgi:hypothetical protein
MINVGIGWRRVEELPDQSQWWGREDRSTFGLLVAENTEGPNRRHYKERVALLY